MTHAKKISIVLFDWSVRESFHAVKYLNEQAGIDRSDYEVLWIEYFDTKRRELEQYLEEGLLDAYAVLGHRGTYRKHRLINEGIVRSRGEIVVNCDSDAMFSPTFVASIRDAFAGRERILLYLDEVRNRNPRHYPFSYPDWEEVLSDAMTVNWVPQLGMTPGVAYDDAVLLEKFGYAGMNIRNYGACLCVRRDDLIRVGGADEHETYDGFICGIYELGWRLVNAGFEEVWHKGEFLLHVYHPWIKPETDVVGPHKNFISTTALKNKEEGMVFPLVEHPGIKALRLGGVARRQGPVRLSVVTAATDPALLDRFCDAVGRSTTAAYEVVAVGPTQPDVERGDLRFVASRACPMGRLDAGCRSAAGELLCIAPEDAIFRPGALDAALAAIVEAGGDHVVASGTYQDTLDMGCTWTAVEPGERFGAAAVGERFGLFSARLFRLLGGFDGRLRQACGLADLSLRCRRAGGTLLRLRGIAFDAWTGNGLGGEDTAADERALLALWAGRDADGRPVRTDDGIRPFASVAVDGTAKTASTSAARPFLLYSKHDMEALIGPMEAAAADKALGSSPGLAATARGVTEKIEVGLLAYLLHKRKTPRLLLDFAAALARAGLPQEAHDVLAGLCAGLLLLDLDNGCGEEPRACLAEAYCRLAAASLAGGKEAEAARLATLGLLVEPGNPKIRRLRARIVLPECIIDAV